MIESTRNPFIFIALLTLSCLFFLFSTLSYTTLGLFYTLWSFFIFAQLLWLLETIFLHQDPRPDHKTILLPWKILSTMDLNQRVMHGLQSLQSITQPVVLWFVFGTFYLLWALYVRLSPHYSYEYYDWLMLIQAAFQKISPDYTVQGFDAGGHHAIARALFVLICGFVFWLTLSIMLIIRKPAYMLTILGGIFITSSVAQFFISGLGAAVAVSPDLWKGYGWGFWEAAQIMDYHLPEKVTPLGQRLVELGKVGVGLLYLPCMCVLWLLIRNLSNPAPHAVYALGGLFVIACLALADCFLANTSGIQAVWMSGWALVGGFVAVSQRLLR